MQGNTSTGLVPGFTAHAQGSAAWSDRSDSPLATNLYVTSSGKLPPAFEVPPRGPSQSQSAMLPAQCSLPSAARSASTEPASHSAGSDLMHAAVLSGPGAVGCTSCALSGQTLTGGNSCWTLPPASVFNSLGIPKSLSGGSPRGHLGGMCRGDSVQGFAEMDAARVVQDSNELATVASATGGDAHSVLPCALGSAPEGMWDNVNAARRVELARLGVPRGIHSCAALSRAASSPCAVVRPPDTAQGLAGFVQADADSQRNAQGHDASANGHASADLADGPCTTVPPLELARNMDSRSTPSGGGKLQRVCSLGGAWEGVLRHDRSASDSDPARHALVTPRIPYTVGMEAVSRSGSIGHATSQGIADVTDSSAATGSGQFARGRSPSRHEDGRAPDSVTLRQLTDTAESSTAGVGSSQGIAAQWQGLSQSLWRGRGMLADSAGPSRLLREVGDTVAEASWQPLAPDIDIGDVGGTGALDGDPCMRRLCRQLDSFRDSDVFLGRFRMLGRQQRRHGGAALECLHYCTNATVLLDTDIAYQHLDIDTCSLARAHRCVRDWCQLAQFILHVAVNTVTSSPDLIRAPCRALQFAQAKRLSSSRRAPRARANTPSSSSLMPMRSTRRPRCTLRALSPLSTATAQAPSGLPAPLLPPAAARRPLNSHRVPVLRRGRMLTRTVLSWS